MASCPKCGTGKARKGNDGWYRCKRHGNIRRVYGRDEPTKEKIVNDKPIQTIGSRGDVFDTLSAIDRGGLTHDVEDALREAVMASVALGKKSRITIELVIDPDTKTDSVRVSGKVSKKLPDAPTKASIFFPTPEGNLTRVNPSQLMLRGTENEYAPPRRTEHDPITGEIKTA